MADLPVELAKAKPKTKAWLNKLRDVVKENAIVNGKNYTVNKHPGGTELVIDFLANLPRKKNSATPYDLGSTKFGSDTTTALPEPPNPDLSQPRLDTYFAINPPRRLDGVNSDGVFGYLTRFYTSTMISYVNVFQRKVLFNQDGSLNAISSEIKEDVTL
jgi:hypothetical protein